VIWKIVLPFFFFFFNCGFWKNLASFEGDDACQIEQLRASLSDKEYHMQYGRGAKFATFLV
jgi:hypothetical protein